MLLFSMKFENGKRYGYSGRVIGSRMWSVSFLIDLERRLQRHAAMLLKLDRYLIVALTCDFQFFEFT